MKRTGLTYPATRANVTVDAEWYRKATESAESGIEETDILRMAEEDVEASGLASASCGDVLETNIDGLAQIQRTARIAMDAHPSVPFDIKVRFTEEMEGSCEPYEVAVNGEVYCNYASEDCAAAVISAMEYGMSLAEASEAAPTA